MDQATEFRQAESAESAAPPPRQARQQSTIQFPYGDLDGAIQVARAIYEQGGGQPCSQDQLVAYLGHEEASGTFRQKVSTARIFGLVELDSPGKTRLTDLGYKVVERGQERQARAEAFLNVELYRKLYDDFRGKPLPPRPVALERTFENYGVASKQKDKARQAFERSAQQAGFFEHGRDRLVMPSGASPPRTEDAPRPSARTGGGDSGDGGGLGLDPLIEGLLKRMPPPAQGWQIDDRARWVQTFVMNLSFIYGDSVEDDIIEVTVRRRQRDEQ